jgi:catechol 2,3-dioxygenase-like lactoylglutathione lyase family enzyme
MTGLTLIVLRCADIERSRAFYEQLGLSFTAEQHGSGPQHLACVLDDGAVLELYPRSARTTQGLRFGLRLRGPGEPRTIEDPDGHGVALTFTR